MQCLLLPNSIRQSPRIACRCRRCLASTVPPALGFRCSRGFPPVSARPPLPLLPPALIQLDRFMLRATTRALSLPSTSTTSARALSSSTRRSLPALAASTSSTSSSYRPFAPSSVAPFGARMSHGSGESTVRESSRVISRSELSFEARRADRRFGAAAAARACIRSRPRQGPQ